MTRRAALTVAVGLVLALGAACTNDDAGPSPTTDPTAPTTVVDRSGIGLAAVGGATTSTIVEVGTATIAGTVQGPSGLVPGATVRIERLVAGREVRTDVLTGPDGHFSVGGLPGGRYRVRAFLAPSLAQLAPEVRFLEDGQAHSFDLKVDQQGGVVVRADVAPEPPVVDQAVNLVASVATREVGADGVVRTTPVVGATVELVGLGRWELRDDSSPGADPSGDETTTTLRLGTTTTTARRQPSAVARTDASGLVRFELRCVTAGDAGLALRVPVTVTPPPDPTGAVGPPQVTTQQFDLEVPACVESGAATTTSSTGPSTTAGGPSTTRP